MNFKSTCLALLTLACPGTLVYAGPASAIEPSPRVESSQQKKRQNLKHFNLGKKGLAIQGYDPVAYFKVGGGKPTQGKKELAYKHLEVTYHFSSKANLETFKKDPAKYEPVFGGWCAYAMADKDKVEIDPKSFLIQDGKLHLFYNGFWGDTRKKWSKDPKGLKVKADQGWAKFTKKKSK